MEEQKNLEKFGSAIISEEMALEICNRLFSSVGTSEYFTDEDRRMLGSLYFDIQQKLKKFHTFEKGGNFYILEEEVVKNLFLDPENSDPELTSYANSFSPTLLALAAGNLLHHKSLSLQDEDLARKSLYFLINFTRLNKISKLIESYTDENPWVKLPQRIADTLQRVSTDTSQVETDERLHGRVVSFRN